MTVWCVFKMVGFVLVFSYLMIGIICAVKKKAAGVEG